MIILISFYKNQFNQEILNTLYQALSFWQKRIITYEMTYFNSKYNQDKEVPKASYIFVLWTVNTFDWLLPPLYVYTCTYCFVLFLNSINYKVYPISSSWRKVNENILMQIYLNLLNLLILKNKISVNLLIYQLIHHIVSHQNTVSVPNQNVLNQEIGFICI